ncbi:MAG: hypothetical protein RLZZ399_956 [Verrucomicrobiota bacterium]|jgi:hypothetical protein
MIPDRPPGTSRRPSATGFTLLELMSAIAVLTLLCSLVLQVTSSTTKLSSNSRESTDCDTEARYAINQIAADLAKRVQRSDVSALLQKENVVDDRLYLFSETPGYAESIAAADRSPISLVGYRIRSEGTSIGLQRYARALSWKDDNINPTMPFVCMSKDPVPSAIPETTLEGAFPGLLRDDPSEDKYYQTIAENVVRIEFSLIKKPNPDSISATTATLIDDSEIKKELNQFGFTRISAVVVTLAIMDPQNMARISPKNFEALRNFVSAPNFDTDKGDPGTSGITLPLQTWNEELLRQVKNLPKPVSAGIHFYQRIISL